MRAFSSYIFVTLVLVLAACVPSVESERVAVEQLSQPISYYPHETGAVWNYLPDSARLDELPLVQRVDGPTIVDGEVWISWQLEGRGLDVRSFRQYRVEGVFLKREVRPGTEINFDPPIHEFPSSDALRVGATWAGKTTAHLFYPQASPEHQRESLMIEYRYTVVDRRTVSLVAGDFEVFVVNFVTRTFDDEGGVLEEFTQESWFSPYVGEVKNENGFFLIDTNFLNLLASN
ncbi:MAG: hypothetical protein JSV66_07290 [Trueperaceae bacterium]|nr:MAG: hypothetical protein JSV66_07290 [Trueperaceae bacterium]